MPKSSFTNFLLNRDVFGQPISVMYKGNDTYRTKMGVLWTFFITVLVIVNTVSLVEGFMDGSRQTESQ